MGRRVDRKDEGEIDPLKAKEILAQLGQAKKLHFEVFTSSQNKVRIYLYPNGQLLAYNANPQILAAAACCLEKNHGRQIAVDQTIWAYVGQIVITNYAEVYPLPYRADNYVYLPKPQEGQVDNRLGSLVELKVTAIYAKGLLSLESNIY